MFENNLMGLTLKEKEVFDAVCVHLNKCLRRRNIRSLDGEEDQILIDLWMDSFPYKLDEKGNYIMRTIREKVWATVDGKYVETYREKQVRELDFTKSLIEETSIGIYKWRGEQLLINKCKYLYGDRRVRKLNSDGKGETVIEVDAWGNKRVKAVYKDGSRKVSKRDLSLNINECDLSNDEDNPMTLDDVIGGTSMDLDTLSLKISLQKVLSDNEMELVKLLMEGESLNSLYTYDKNLTSKKMRMFKEKVGKVLKEYKVELVI